MRKKTRYSTVAAALLIVVCVVGVVFFMQMKRERGFGEKEGVVTIEIRCKELIEHPEQLTKPEIAQHLPENGEILPKTTWTIRKGETVFDVLKAVCKKEEIPLEYSYTPGYGAYYVEGISHLYEFYAGKRSGWVYQIDGEQAEYGCSQYELDGGETILWEYVCNYASETNEF